MRRMVKRVLLLLAAAGLWAGVGSALVASPAFAGGVYQVWPEQPAYHASIYNLTPYTWTLVAQNSFTNVSNGECGTTCWLTPPAQTIEPGKSMGYELYPNTTAHTILNDLFGAAYWFDAYMTYRVDVAGGPAEYVTVAVTHCQCSGQFSANNPGLLLEHYITTQPPPANYRPSQVPDNVAPAPSTVNPQLGYDVFKPTDWDLTYHLVGDHTIDASTDQGAPFVALLNSICGADKSACSFTQTSPLVWGIGGAVKAGQALNCTVAGSTAQGSQPAAGASDEPPPALDPNWFEVEYKAAQSASLSVGGGVTVGTEFNLFDTISGKISIKVEAEHEWQETKTYTRSARVYIPSNNIAGIWVAPTVGKVSGTLVLTLPSAKITAINFTETRSGVTKDVLTPAFNVITKIRPMTDSEYQRYCADPSSTRLGAAKGLGAPQAKPPVKLTPGRGVARVGLGDTQEQVLRALGRPAVKRFVVDPCQGLGRGCDATAGMGGRWTYRQLSVVFASDLRVSGVIYSGTRLSAKRVGVGSRISAVRAAYPRLACTGPGKQRSCTLPGKLAGRAVTTVFRFARTRTGRYDCDRVAIYLMSGSAEVTR